MPSETLRRSNDGEMMMKTSNWIAASVLPLALAAACSSSEPEPVEVGPTYPSLNIAPAGEPHEMLSEWGLFTELVGLTPNAAVIEFDNTSPLYTDYAFKQRFMWLPEGTQIAYDPLESWDFPVGAILVKMFGYQNDERDPSKGVRWIETRLLVHESDTKWAPQVYIWNDEGTDAVREIAGETIDVEWVDKTGATRQLKYGVPNTNICGDCHGVGDEINNIGARTRMLNRDFDHGDGPVNQIDHLASLGLFASAPEPFEDRLTLVDPFGTAGSLDDRTRSYFDSNCAHCHAEGRQAAGSNLLLDWKNTDPETGDPAQWGVCKMPSSAGGATCGLSVDVEPGNPEDSILVCRMASHEGKVRMPPVGTGTPHTEAVELISEWIAAMDAVDCSAAE
jgi:uncharacterized repeat protein (TIGR03806 family)